MVQRDRKSSVPVIGLALAPPYSEAQQCLFAEKISRAVVPIQKGTIPHRHREPYTINIKPNITESSRHEN